MKLSLLSAAMVLAAADLFGQGTVNFANFNGINTRPLTNVLTAQPLAMGTSFSVSISFLPDSQTPPTTQTFDRNGISLNPPVTIGPAAGLFNGGVRTAPTTPAGGSGYFQVRAWETAFGTSYLQALRAPAMGGRPALIGTSNILKIDTGDPTTVPAGTPTPLLSAGLQAFTLVPGPGSGPPGISINDITVVIGSGGPINAVFTISLSQASSQTVTVQYATANGTALANVDYYSASGTLTFDPGDLSKTISVALAPAIYLGTDKTFFVNLSSPVNSTIDVRQGICTITELHIESFSINAVISFQTIQGHIYAVDKTLSLNPVSWQPVPGSTNAGTGGVITVLDRGSALSESHYRVRLIQ